MITSTLIGILIYIGFAAYIDFKKTAGTFWQRAKAAAKNRLTVLWGYVMAVVTLALQGAEHASIALNLPEVTTLINERVNPEYVGYAFTTITVITIVARLRAIYKG